MSEDDLIAKLEAHVRTGNNEGIMALGVIQLFRIAEAQEKLVSLANINLEADIEAEIENRAQVKAEEITKAKEGRSFIGRR